MKPGNGLFYDPLGPSPAANSTGFTPVNSTGFTESNSAAARSWPQQGHRPDASTGGGTHSPARQTHPDTGRAAAREAALQSVRRDLERLARLRTAP
ncbi:MULTISPECIES: hypothetical protein [Arthrobacter]|uniref:Uncharacterized protein n=1 Tax=Arthrobacter bambusae TaxID=1338426 RepID=A0AAW8DMB0_9MICC|nr:MULTISPECIES: hypothetical protein [Arthrobacter]MDP9907492.1 hypothetical protein [Arthrobacter bambusae]MDQ0131697.1 hypothetical protein [Arthrobacter bambusae]MDQ0183109.1 hypothetical protein [Arthrobacter bambusae]